MNITLRIRQNDFIVEILSGDTIIATLTADEASRLGSKLCAIADKIDELHNRKIEEHFDHYQKSKSFGW